MTCQLQTSSANDESRTAKIAEDARATLRKLLSGLRRASRALFATIHRSWVSRAPAVTPTAAAAMLTSTTAPVTRAGPPLAWRPRAARRSRVVRAAPCRADATSSPAAPPDASSSTSVARSLEFMVEMSCGKCVAAVETACASVTGVEAVVANLAQNTVRVVAAGGSKPSERVRGARAGVGAGRRDDDPSVPLAVRALVHRHGRAERVARGGSAGVRQTLRLGPRRGIRGRRGLGFGEDVRGAGARVHVGGAEDDDGTSRGGDGVSHASSFTVRGP